LKTVEFLGTKKKGGSISKTKLMSLKQTVRTKISDIYIQAK